MNRGAPQRILYLLTIIFLTALIGSTSADKRSEFPPTLPIIENPPSVESGEILKEESPDPQRIFAHRYYRARQGETWGPRGLTVSLRQFPEVGILYKAWRIKVNEDGEYDFTSAIFAFQKDGGGWYAVPAGFIPKAALDAGIDTTVVYENEKTLVYRRMVPPALGGREKFVATVVRQLWTRERHTRFTIKSVIIKLGKPGDPGKDPPDTLREAWVSELKFPQPKIIDMIKKLK